MAADLGWRFARDIGLETSLVPAPYKPFDLNNPAASTRTGRNRDGTFLPMVAALRGWLRCPLLPLASQARPTSDLPALGPKKPPCGGFSGGERGIRTPGTG